MNAFVVAKMVRLVPNAAIGYLKSSNTELYWVHSDEETVNLNLKEIDTILFDTISSTVLLSAKNQIKMLHFLQETDLTDFALYLTSLKDVFEEGESNHPYMTFNKKRNVEINETVRRNADLDKATLNVLDAFSKVPLLARGLFKQLRNEPQYLHRPRGIPTSSKIPVNPWIHDRPLQLPACRMHFDQISGTINTVPAGVKATMVYNSAGKIIIGEERADFWEFVLADETNLADSANSDNSEDLVRIEKDLYRLGEDDENVIKRLKEFLQLYARHDPEVGYVQGMADLALPFARIFETAQKGFDSFRGLMLRMRSNFLCHESENGIETQLKQLRALIHESSPLLSDYLKFNRDSDNLFFAYRWLLVLFRREFKEYERLWTVMLAAEASGIAKIEEFRVFVGLAMILSKKSEFMNTCNRFEDLLKFFNDLSSKWDLDEILQLTDQLINYHHK